MKNRFYIVCAIVLGQFAFAQLETEIYLFDLSLKDSTITLSNPKNITNNPGYDNQPSFLDDKTVLFSSTRSEQTDILQFNIEDGSTKEWLTDTPTGSEYSPLKIPGKQAISAIRLDLDGLQRLYAYNLKNGKSKVLLDNLKVGYHVWANAHTIVCTVLQEKGMDLVVSNLKDGTNYTVQKNVGRSLHKIPNSNLISYISKEEEQWQIKSLNPISRATEKILPTYGNTEDICWLPNGTILTGADKALVIAKPTQNKSWEQLRYFPQDEIHGISRIAVNPSATRVAFVSLTSPVTAVDQQLKAYNQRDLEAFAAAYSDAIEIYNYPETLIAKGKEKFKEMYRGFFKTTPDLNCQIKNRIVLGKKVIDEEEVTVNGNTFGAIAIYEVENNKIVKVTFIQ